MKTLTSGTDEFMVDAAGEGSPGPNPIMMVHRALRGRYLWAVALGAVLAVPGAVVGYIALPPEYTSRAVLEISPTLPALLYENELNESMPAFEAFVGSQATALQSERVLSNALNNSALRGVGWPSGAPGLIRLRDSLSVTNPRRSNQVFISVSDHNPELARLAAAAVLESYEAIRREYEATTFGQREHNLERLRDSYQRERDEKRRIALDRALSVAGTEDLQAAQRAKLADLSRIEQEIDQVRMRLAQLDGAVVADPALSDDAELSRLQRERQQIQRTIDTLLMTLTREHRQVRRMQTELDVLDSLIEARQNELASLGGDAGPSTPASAGRDTVKTRLDDLGRMKADAERAIERFARTRLDVLALQQEADEANSRFEDAERRLESLRVEKQAQIVGRIRIAQEPEHPLAPTTDRRLPLAAMGLMGGGGMGVALVAGIGLFFPRLRVVDDVANTARDFSVLGMIPEFPATMDNGAEQNIRESFQFLRVMLDARNMSDCLVAGVTSPTSGDGKTVISLMLARSFAMTRRRVLLIDADLVGRGLTRMLKVEPREDDTHSQTRLEDLVVPVDDGSLDFFPASGAETAADSFCRHVLQRLLATARERYDVVLLDTGPILGSIEAAAMAPVVGQMLLVVPRGLESRLLRMSADRLRDMHASSVGLIFNRATTVDFNRSFAPTSSVSRRHSVRDFSSIPPPSMVREPADHVGNGGERRVGADT